MLAYLIFFQYCSLGIVNKPRVWCDSFIMYTELYQLLPQAFIAYTELYHLLPQASLPLRQMHSSHLLITMINLLSADQNSILLNH